MLLIVSERDISDRRTSMCKGTERRASTVQSAWKLKNFPCVSRVDRACGNSQGIRTWLHHKSGSCYIIEGPGLYPVGDFNTKVPQFSAFTYGSVRSLG